MQVPGRVEDTPHARSAAVVLACEHLCLHAAEGTGIFPPLYDKRGILKKGGPPYASKIASMPLEEVAAMHAVVSESVVGAWETAVSAAGVALPPWAAELTTACRWWVREEDKAHLKTCRIGGRTLKQIRCGHDCWP